MTDERNYLNLVPSYFDSGQFVVFHNQNILQLHILMWVSVARHHISDTKPKIEY